MWEALPANKSGDRNPDSIAVADLRALAPIYRAMRMPLTRALSGAFTEAVAAALSLSSIAAARTAIPQATHPSLPK
ncbi:MAG TPA: hypothetical protein VMV40_02590 [Acidiferrobacter sp.]|nr:hypothetical protein [Acidiferrobacter sp.]